ncbi:hypothetical protein PROFUN_07444 [Planoprotostelium fungivorum]|uniref:Uncharacterized protein n=1 Tax=Planoprotostelium fungivorum TaxID=1890364 RepID=A0A2P6NLE8_9EUKA|nr:hypothetical protein PROFUN_07444 [Planoprotostelium fungivorum]
MQTLSLLRPDCNLDVVIHPLESISAEYVTVIDCSPDTVVVLRERNHTDSYCLFRENDPTSLWQHGHSQKIYSGNLLGTTPRLLSIRKT